MPLFYTPLGVACGPWVCHVVQPFAIDRHRRVSSRWHKKFTARTPLLARSNISAPHTSTSLQRSALGISREASLDANTKRLVTASYV